MKKNLINTNDQKQFGVFETIRFTDGNINLEGFHFERLFDGMKKLKINKPEDFTIEKIRDEIRELCRKNDCYRKARVRVTVISPFNYLIESFSLDEELNREGLIIDIFPGEKKSCDPFSTLKLSDRSLYEKAEKFAKENDLDDCLILNEYDRVCESTISNIFWIKNKMIFTPPLSEGCVAGVMRRYLLEKIRESVYGIQEKELSSEELMEADEIFLTNAIRGIRSVKQFRNKLYRIEQSLKMKNDLLEDFT